MHLSYVLFMASNESDVTFPMAQFQPDDQTVLVSSDVENDPVISD